MHLLWYGCSREVIKGTGLVSPDLFPAISQQRLVNYDSLLFLSLIPRRRRVYSRYNADSHVLNADRTFIKLLTRIAVNGPEDICIIIAKFLSALVSDSSHIDSQDIDNFILQNGKALAQWYTSKKFPYTLLLKFYLFPYIALGAFTASKHPKLAYCVLLFFFGC